MMTLELFEDNLEKKDCMHLTPRKGVRAILKHEDSYVLIHNQAIDLYTLPGGGVEPGESFEEALKREVLEETGYHIDKIEKTLTLKEYFYDSLWEHHFYYCETIGEKETPSLTKEEKAFGLTTTLKTYDEVLMLFESHESPHEFYQNIYQREFLGFIHSTK
jgi:8-oxo-dGTP pyrophosphatase MutT (NUDIX family)